MATQQEVIKKFMKSLDTHTFSWSDKNFMTKILDNAINYATRESSRPFSTIAKAIEEMLNDCKNAKSADDFLKTYCGINLDDTDTGAITGSNAGGSATKTPKSVVPETKTATGFTKSSFTVNGLTVKLGKTYANLSAYEKYIWNNLHEHWIKGGLDLIAQSYGNNFGFGSNSSATVKEITVTFFEKKGGVLAETSPVFNTGNSDDDYVRKSATGLTLSINLAYYKANPIISSDSDGKPNDVMNLFGGAESREAYLDRTIAHEMTHAVMYANINYLALLPRYILEGMAELTSGADDLRKSDLKALAANSSKLKSALNGTSSIVGVSNPTYSGGYMFLRWLAKQASGSGITDYADSIKNTVSSATINALGGNDTISNTGSKVKINGGAGNDSIKNDAYNVTINGGSDNDSITGYYDTITNNGSCVTINVGNGNDSIKNYGDKASIFGGAGSDTILSYGGKNSKLDGGSGNDTILNGGVSKSGTIIWGTKTVQSSAAPATILLKIGAIQFILRAEQATIRFGNGTSSNSSGGVNVTI